VAQTRGWQKGEQTGGALGLAWASFVVVTVAAAVTAGLLLLWRGREVFLLTFAAILLAVLLHGLAQWLSAVTPLSRGWALALVILALAGACVGGVWLFAPGVALQIQQLSQNLSFAIERLRGLLAQYSWGQSLLDSLPGALTAPGSNLIARATNLFSTALGAVVNMVVVLFLGFYLAASPGLYTGGLVRLLPEQHRQRMCAVLATLGRVLQRWLAGRFLLMAANGLLTSLGLLWLGVPLPWTLGVLAGLLNFIPNLGPVIAAVPALLIALAQSPRQALYVLVLYLVLQSLDGYVFTPLVQRRTVALPPALTIGAQVLLGVLFGGLGVLLATPLAASVLVLVKMLYLHDTLHEQITLPGRSGEQAVQGQMHARERGAAS